MRIPIPNLWPWRHHDVAPQSPTPVQRLCDEHEIAEHQHSIWRIPRELLPDGLARETLADLVNCGCDVYAYASGGEEHGTWCIWFGPLADVRDDFNGRVTVEQWRDHWQELYREALSRTRTGGGAA